MNDRPQRPISSPPRRPETSDAVPDVQARALERRQSLAAQHRAYQSAPASQVFRRRPPG